MYPEEPAVAEDKFHFLFGHPVYCDLRHHLFEKKNQSKTPHFIFYLSVWGWFAEVAFFKKQPVSQQDL